MPHTAEAIEGGLTPILAEMPSPAQGHDPEGYNASTMKGEWEVRIDPWAVEYGAETPGVSGAEEEVAEQVDLDVERPAGEWHAIPATSTRLDGPVCFVDGVRRIDVRLLVTRGAHVVHGAAGSFGVGAVRADGVRAAFTDLEVGRLVIFGSGQRPAGPLDLGQGLTYVPRSAADADADAPLRALHEDMRGAESALAARLSAAGALVVADGPLNLGTSQATTGTVVGFVKRLFRTYVAEDQLAVVRRLATGHRTPVFLIRGRFARYSWFTRLGPPLRMESEFTGIVRLEVAEGVGAAEAVRLAARLTGWLPSFAPTRARDPRAPQNLVPIGALERHLRHRLGDQRLIRRRLATLLARESAHA